MALEDDGVQAFSDDDEDRISGLDMRWDLARPLPPPSVLREWAREAKYELRHCEPLRAALAISP